MSRIEKSILFGLAMSIFWVVVMLVADALGKSLTMVLTAGVNGCIFLAATLIINAMRKD